MSRTILFCCASVLALAIAASASDAASSKHAAGPAPVANAPAAPAPAAPADAAAAASPVGGPASYDVKGIDISGVYGSVKVNVVDHGPVTLATGGPKNELDKLQVSTSGGVLHLTQENMGHVWNWHEWFDFKTREKREKITLVLNAPKGTSLAMDDFVGDFAVGDLAGPVKIDAAAANGTVGNVTSAEIGLAGSGRITVGTVQKDLKVEIAGSGTVIAGASANAAIEIGGSGDATLGPVLGGLKVEIAGSGDVHVASVNGPTSAETAGAGSIKIDTGEANPLTVDLIGSGDFDFGGEAVNPSIDAMGSGDVTLKSYRGKLSTEGMTHVKIVGNSNP